MKALLALLVLPASLLLPPLLKPQLNAAQIPENLGIGSAPIVSQSTEAPAKDRGLRTLRPYNISVSVPNLDEAINWYRDKLGFKLESRVRFSPEVEIAMIELNGFRIEFLQVANSRKLDALHRDPPEHLRILGIKNIVFLVDDLSVADAELKAKGVKLLWESRSFKEANAKVTMFRDNNDNLVTLWQLLPKNQE